MNKLAQEVAKNILCDDPEIEYRIESGIENNRKGFMTIRLEDSKGQPLQQAMIKFRQINHEYHFGCNAFMLDQFQEDEKNTLYRERFSELFNLAVVPFYWSDLEPEDGNPRFGKDSAPIYRRPPVDLVLEFCDEHKITPKGHLLCWHEFLPQWLPENQTEHKKRLEKRIAELAQRYADKIPIWDVTNEALQWNPIKSILMPENHVEESFVMAEKYFPASTKLLYNDGPFVSWDSYHGNYTPLYMLVRHLQNSGRRVSGLGLQYHMFKPAENMIDFSHHFLNQNFIYANMDQYAKLGIPLNVSEITISGNRALGDGDRFQELVTEKLYKIWFSHKATNGIIWWNLVDGTAARARQNTEEGENIHRGGMLNYDMSPKPVYNTIKRLLHKEWVSEGKLQYSDSSVNNFRGFYGEYELEIETNLGSEKHLVNLRSDSKNEITIECGVK